MTSDALERGPATALRWGPYLAAAALASLAMVAPGNIPFDVDAWWLVGRANEANAAGVLCDVGLRGTSAVEYGPFAVQVNQLLLILTGYDVLRLAQLRAFAMVLVTGVALVDLARSCGFGRGWLGLLPLLAPNVWFALRGLWDNPICLPATAVMLAAYARLVRDARPLAAGLCLAGAIVAVTTHPMALPVVGAVGVHAALHRRAFAGRRAWIGVIAAILLLLPLFAGYAVHTARTAAVVAEKGRAALRVPEPVGLATPVCEAAGATTQAGELKRPPLAVAVAGSAVGSVAGAMPMAGPFSADPDDDGATVRAARGAMTLYYPLSIVGIVAAGMLALQSRQSTPSRLDRWSLDVLRSSGSVPTAIACVCLLTVVLNALLFGARRLPAAPHYFHGVATTFAVLCWFGFTALRWAPIRIVVATLLCVSSLVQLAHSYQVARRTGGTDGAPTLSAMIAAARALGSSPYEDFDTNFDHVYRWPDFFARFHETIARHPAGVTGPVTSPRRSSDPDSAQSRPANPAVSGYDVTAANRCRLLWWDPEAATDRLRVTVADAVDPRNAVMRVHGDRVRAVIEASRPSRGQ